MQLNYFGLVGERDNKHNTPYLEKKKQQIIA